MVDVAKWVDTVSVRRSTNDSEHRAPRRAKILEAAAECIEEFGPEAGTSQIAERAGVPRPHVYRYFDSKDDLDDQVARFAADALVDRVRPAMSSSGTGAEIVGRVIAETVSWARQNPRLYCFMAVRQQRKVSNGAKLGRGRYFAEVMAASTAYLQASRIEPQGPDGVMAGLIGMVDASIVWWLEKQDESAEMLIERLTRHSWIILRDTLDQLGLPIDDDTLLSL